MENPHTITKTLTLLLLGLLLPLLIIMSLEAGISGDEYLHLEQAEMVLDYYKTFGQDKSALHTPVTNLKYYGQSFDNFTLLVAQIFNVEDLFALRHIFNALAGWLTILFTLLVAVELAGWHTAFIALLLMSATPFFTGHALNNLKDIPFALGYAASLFFMIKWIPRRHLRPIGWWLGLVLSLALLFSIRPGGLLAFAYLWGFTLLTLFYEHRQGHPSLNLAKTIVELIVISGTAWLIGCLFWPYALENPVWHPIKSFIVMSDYPVTIRQLFEGKLQWSDLLPWYYLPKIMLLTIPVAVWLGLALFAATAPFKMRKQKIFTSLNTIFIIIAAFFPVIWIIVTDANVYGSWRHVLFVLPPLAVASAVGFKTALSLLHRVIKSPKIVNSLGLVALILLLWHPLKFTIRNQPLQYLYFNQLAGGLKNAFGNYEADYYFHTIKPAAEWLKNHLRKTGERDVILASNFETAWYFRDSEVVVQHPYTNYYNKEYLDWDYGIFAAAYLYKATIDKQLWPPKGTIHTINVEGVPVCAVVKRPTNATYEAVKAMGAGHYEKADSLLAVAIAKDPNNENSWLQAGLLSLKMGNTEEALLDMEETLHILPNYEPALLNLGKIYAGKGQWTKALETLTHLLIVNPKYLPAYLERADVYLHFKEFEKAKKILNDCLTIKPGYTPAIEKLNTIDYL